MSERLTGGYEVGYTGIYNVLDYSCVSFPTGLTADKDIDLPRGGLHKPMSVDCEAIHVDCKYCVVTVHRRLLAEVDAVPDAPAAIHGMPISLQLVSRRLEDEKVVAVTRRVLEVLGGRW